MGTLRSLVSRNLGFPKIRQKMGFEIHTDSPAAVSPLLYSSVEFAVAEAVEVKLGDSEELLLPGETEAAG